LPNIWENTSPANQERPPVEKEFLADRVLTSSVDLEAQFPSSQSEVDDPSFTLSSKDVGGLKEVIRHRRPSLMPRDLQQVTPTKVLQVNYIYGVSPKLCT
jgi:hypothetical protein